MAVCIMYIFGFFFKLTINLKLTRKYFVLKPVKNLFKSKQTVGLDKICLFENYMSL